MQSSDFVETIPKEWAARESTGKGRIREPWKSTTVLGTCLSGVGKLTARMCLVSAPYETLSSPAHQKPKSKSQFQPHLRISRLLDSVQRARTREPRKKSRNMSPLLLRSFVLSSSQSISLSPAPPDDPPGRRPAAGPRAECLNLGFAAISPLSPPCPRVPRKFYCGLHVCQYILGV